MANQKMIPEGMLIKEKGKPENSAVCSQTPATTEKPYRIAGRSSR
jgi:hypothetical protein